ncbi:ribbon-helix-helix domain-containing protein [Parerythrobacter aurantius]|uniref:ribbon-helix-helix domain-containing protein n=1 Tax=Parerythrobacter aurantius TaxID=3127706 RepID=UPI00324ADEE9
MTRILADLPDDDIEWLDKLAAEQGKSRAQVLREAVSGYRAHSPADGNKSWIKRGAGLWKDRNDIAEGVDYQRAIRQDRRGGGHP